MKIHQVRIVYEENQKQCHDRKVWNYGRYIQKYCYIIIVYRTDANSLFAKDRIDLNEMYADPRIAIVFALDFILSLNSNQVIFSTSGQLYNLFQPDPPSQSFIVCWAAWCPFAQTTLPDLVVIPLSGGPSVNPDESLCFKNLVRFGSELPNRTAINNVLNRYSLVAEMTENVDGLQKKKKVSRITAQFNFSLKKVIIYANLLSYLGVIK
jgi:hypothetical protein